MNGAELPCGSVLRVEPARSNRDHVLRQHEPDNWQSQSTNDSSSAIKHAAVQQEEGEASVEGDEELDDFFDSL